MCRLSLSRGGQRGYFGLERPGLEILGRAASDGARAGAALATQVTGADLVGTVWSGAGIESGRWEFGGGIDLDRGYFGLERPGLEILDRAASDGARAGAEA
jgi:hypothetical protein